MHMLKLGAHFLHFSFIYYCYYPLFWVLIATLKNIRVDLIAIFKKMEKIGLHVHR